MVKSEHKLGGGGGGRGLYDDVTSKNYDKNGYGRDLELTFISHACSHPTRHGCRAKTVHLRPFTLVVVKMTGF